MNVFELKEFNKERVIYLYQPEGKGEFGEVSYDYVGNTARLLKKAGDASVWHANKALSKVAECAKGKELPLKFIQAWY